MAHDVFISYAIEDRRTAESICAALEKSGITCWFAPRNVPFGVDYEEAIVDGIYDSRLVILILSKHSNGSPHVRREIQNASVEGTSKPILPVRIDDVSLSKALRYYLSSAQWLDASTPPLEQHLERLVEQLRSRLPPAEKKIDTATKTDTGTKTDNGTSEKHTPLISENSQPRRLEPDLTQDQVVDVAMQVAPSIAPKKFPLWIVFVIPGVLLLAGIIVLVLILKNASEPNNNRTSSPSSVISPKQTSPSPSISPKPDGRYEGKWINADPNTRGITRLVIERDRSQLSVHGFGSCTPQDCDWGVEKAQ